MTSRAKPVEQEVARSDRRWMGVTTLVFALAVALLSTAYALYRATGPHPLVRALLRRTTWYAHWILPDFRLPKGR